MTSSLPRLIEVALPIREISAESVRDKSLRQGHISTLHLWWARRPLAASRAVVFASLVPDPDHPECPAEFRDAVNRLLKTNVPKILHWYFDGKRQIPDNDPYRPYKNIEDTPRNRLLTFIAKLSPQQIAFDAGQTVVNARGKVKEPATSEKLDTRCLVKWETSNPENEQGREVLNIARKLILIANGGKHPVLLDPFSGGGAIPLEGMRLGAQSLANDYNPVAYLILRATCEFPQKFGKPGKRMVEREEYGKVKHEEIEVDNVLAYDVEYFAKQILERSQQQIGMLYLTGKDGKPIVTYLWARTATCSNPTCRAQMPLLRSLLVCDTEHKQVAITMTRVGKDVVFGIAKNKEIKEIAGTMVEKGKGSVRCPICNQNTPVGDLRREGLEGKLGERMIAVVVNTPQGKDYRPVEEVDLEAFEQARRIAMTVEKPSEYIVPEINAPGAPTDAGSHRSISVEIYGFKQFVSLFNPRQLVAMQTFVGQIRKTITDLEKTESNGEYRKAIAAYLALWITRISQRSNSFCTWNPSGEKVQPLYGRQSIGMVWDYPEIPAFSESFGSPLSMLEVVTDFIKHETPKFSSYIPVVNIGDGAHLPFPEGEIDVVVTDPPYFDSIAYADLSDFFYVWLKRSIGDLFPEAFSTPQTPKSEEAVAHKHRHHGNREKGKQHFQRKLTECFSEAKRLVKPDSTIAIMFAHQDTDAWMALINSIFDAGLTVTATYPIDTELTTALKRDVSALASSITVICRTREVSAAVSFRDVRREIEKSVAESVHRFWGYGFRGADLIVACYGPAVGVFGHYTRVERADGTPVTVPELLDLARDSALKAIAGEFTGDPLSRLYFIWANLYGISEQSWDDVRLVVQIGGESEDAMDVARGRGLFVVDGSTCRLALLHDRVSRRHLGDESDAPLIDQLHHAMQLWKEEKRVDLVKYLRENDLLDHVPYWKLAQALFEVLPRDEEDWKLISSLLGERETLRLEAKRSEQPKQQSLFDS
jgi:putative DNA methylase